MKFKRKFIFTALVTLACVFQGCINDKEEPEGPSLAVRDSLPAFSVVMNDGTVISNTSLRGKVAVIVFFNTGCPDCREELPVIEKLWLKYEDDENVAIVPIAREEGYDEILGYWRENNFTMPFSPQDNREVYSLFASSIIPRIYITDKQGVIIAGYGDTDMPSLQTLVKDIESASKS